MRADAHSTTSARTLIAGIDTLFGRDRHSQLYVSTNLLTSSYGYPGRFSYFKTAARS